MDTIDGNTMQYAAAAVILASRDLPIIHTVTVTLNGAHGGADVTIEGFTDDTDQEQTTVQTVIPR